MEKIKLENPSRRNFNKRINRFIYIHHISPNIEPIRFNRLYKITNENTPRPILINERLEKIFENIAEKFHAMPKN